MKKPLIIIVDDDSSVLEALEATLTPTFGEIARIEAFTEPDHALAQLPHWRQEDRSVAVTIVDQKMPGMTGVEFLQRLQESRSRADEEADERFDPVEHTRSVLLTGYAALDSAIAAKNLAGVDRYREKPWRAQDLLEDVRSSFARFLETSDASRHTVFRELHDPTEIEEHLRLRYRVFRDVPHLFKLLPDTAEGIDVDQYDLVSNLMGLFLRTGGGGERLVGSHRYVGTDPSRATPALEQLVARRPELKTRMHQPRLAFPVMEYVEERDALEQLLNRLSDTGEQVREASRLALDASVRSGSAGRKLAIHIIESVMAFLAVFDVPNVLTAVILEHKALYEAYGCDEVYEGFCPTINRQFCCLHGTFAGLPDRVRSRVQSMAKRIELTGATCHCRAFRACLRGPYETGEFRTTDLFCPLKAHECVRERVGEGNQSDLVAQRPNPKEPS